MDLLILVGTSAEASIMTRAVPEDEAPAFRSAGSVAAGSGQGRRVGLQDLTPYTPETRWLSSFVSRA